MLRMQNKIPCVQKSIKKIDYLVPVQLILLMKILNYLEAAELDFLLYKK